MHPAEDFDQQPAAILEDRALLADKSKLAGREISVQESW